MEATRFDLVIPQGSDFEQEFTWMAGDPLAPVDLTGFTVEAQIRYAYGGDLILDFSSDITLGDAAGTILIDIPAADTENLSWIGSAVWDLVLINGTERDRFLEGKAFLSLGATE